MNASNQLPFTFDHRPSLSGDDFLIASSNEEAISWIDKWPDWPTPLLIIFGPPGCGKTHLSNVFMAKADGQLLMPSNINLQSPEESLSIAKNFVIDDNNRDIFAVYDEKSFFHFYNELVMQKGFLLITSHTSPLTWKVKLADLSSRIRSAQMVNIGHPDDRLITAVLAKLFSDYQVRVEFAVIEYIVSRMERSLESARIFVERANQLALIQKKGITRSLVRQVFDKLDA